MTPDEIEVRDNALIIVTATMMRQAAIKCCALAFDKNKAADAIVCVQTPTLDEVKAKYAELSGKPFDALSTAEEKQAAREHEIVHAVWASAQKMATHAICSNGGNREACRIISESAPPDIDAALEGILKEEN